jgi:hypothetical protein
LQSDQLTLKLGKTAQHRQHQPAVRRRRIRPSILEGFEARTLLAQGNQNQLHCPSVQHFVIGPNPRKPSSSTSPASGLAAEHYPKQVEFFDQLGQQFIIENRPAAARCARSFVRSARDAARGLGGCGVDEGLC